MTWFASAFGHPIGLHNWRNRHCSPADHSGISSTVIVVEDKDVIIMAVYFSDVIYKFDLCESGSLNKTKIYINISTIANACGNQLCKATYGVHSFTGCDSVSASVAKGQFKYTETDSRWP